MSQESQKAQCIRCKALILQTTATKTSGLCMPCYRDEEFQKVNGYSIKEGYEKLLEDYKEILKQEPERMRREHDDWIKRCSNLSARDKCSECFIILGDDAQLRYEAKKEIKKIFRQKYWDIKSNLCSSCKTKYKKLGYEIRGYNYMGSCL